ncbi:hypothetical protein [Pseudoxanthomonas putridarboris]|uniref:Uncharacterized protein n=1 Tax=Pseudoxanthomonas putridarboris TaxID=752605 RepID=A0ABU9J7P1_9GAMM
MAMVLRANLMNALKRLPLMQWVPLCAAVICFLAWPTPLGVVLAIGVGIVCAGLFRGMERHRREDGLPALTIQQVAERKVERKFI